MDIHGERESPEERLAGTESTFDIPREIGALRSEPGWQRSHDAKTLVKRSDLRVVLLVLDPGGRLERHQAPGPQPFTKLNSASTRVELWCCTSSLKRTRLARPSRISDISPPMGWLWSIT